jgi:hypothetical protein
MGKIFPEVDYRRPSKKQYALAIAAALRKELAGMPNAIKLVMRWTGANEKTVKNWMAGTHGPAGESLVALAHYSHEVMLALHQMAGCPGSEHNPRINIVRKKLIEALDALEQ